MTLITERPSVRAAEAGAAFATPNVVHFGTVLLLAALLRAPWRAAVAVATFSAIIGLAGMAYELIVARRMGRQDTYPPELEDWLFYLGLPLAAYAGLAASAFAVSSHTREALFGIGASALLLLFLGIRNAWDSIAYHVLVGRSGKTAERRREGS